MRHTCTSVVRVTGRRIFPAVYVQVGVLLPPSGNELQLQHHKVLVRLLQFFFFYLFIYIWKALSINGDEFISVVNINCCL